MHLFSFRKFFVTSLLLYRQDEVLHQSSIHDCEYLIKGPNAHNQCPLVCSGNSLNTCRPLLQNTVQIPSCLCQAPPNKSRLVTQCESLQGFRNPSGRGENDAIVIEAEPRSLLRHSRPNHEGFKTEERLTLVANRLRKRY